MHGKILGVDLHLTATILLVYVGTGMLVVSACSLSELTSCDTMTWGFAAFCFVFVCCHSTVSVHSLVCLSVRPSVCLPVFVSCPSGEF